MYRRPANYIMEINVNVKLTADASFIEALRSLFGAAIAMPTQAGGTKKKADKSASEPSNTVVDPTGNITTSERGNSTTETTVTTEITITVEQVRAAVHAKKEELGGHAKIKALLTECGAESVTALDSSRYEEFLSKLKELKELKK